MGRARSVEAAFGFVILPPVCGMTLLVSELAFATRAMRKAVEQGSSLPVCLSICVQRAALKTPPPFGRTLSFRIRCAPLKRCGLLPPGKLWSPSADSIQSPREWVATAHPLGKHVPQTADKPKETELKHHVQQSHPHRPPRTERRSQNRSEQQRVRRPQHRNPGELEERQRRIRNPH